MKFWRRRPPPRNPFLVRQMPIGCVMSEEAVVTSWEYMDCIVR